VAFIFSTIDYYFFIDESKSFSRASVGGLHALLSMAKYDARFASFSLCKLIGNFYQ